MKIVRGRFVPIVLEQMRFATSSGGSRGVPRSGIRFVRIVT